MSKTCDWTCEEDEILIDFVKNCEILYNVKSKGYRNSQLKLNRWRKIGQQLNKTDIECSKRWSYIRDYYIRRKGKPGTAREAAKKRFDLLSFLDDYSSIKWSNKIPDTENNDNTKDIAAEENDVIQNIEKNQERWYDANVKINSECEVVFDEGNDEKVGYRTKSAGASTSNSEKYSNSLKCIVERQQQLLPSVAQEQDETDLFFASMAKTVKKLPEYDRAQLRLQIGSLVGNAELKYLSSIKK